VRLGAAGRAPPSRSHAGTLAEDSFGATLSAMGGSVTASVARTGRVTRLSNVTCTLGRLDRPYPEIHESGVWTVALVRRGTFRYRSERTNEQHALRAGWLLFGHPQAEYECSHDHDGGDECASLSIPEDCLWDVARVASTSEKAILATPAALPPLPRVAALLERARLREGVDLDEIGYLIAESILTRTSKTPTVARHPSHVGRMHHAMDRIEADCREPLPLGELASSVGLSPFHFLRVFRSVSGTTPHQYLIGARLRLAVRMLLDTQLPVTRIAYDVGFQDLSNFVNTFRRVVGCSPGAYRRSA
jgi:AraC family transcriptional regulator